MPEVRVELTVEPFTEGVLGPHVSAAIEALELAGFEPDIGPFGNAVQGEAEAVWPAVGAAAIAAFGSGATGLAVSARVVRAGSEGSEEFLVAMRGVAKAIGSRVVTADDVGTEDVPLVWRGELVGGLHTPGRPQDLREGVGLLVSQVEVELGGALAELPRTEKQRAVRLLDERGAFAFRNAVDEVADVMGVSRVTVYNYLNATRAGP